MSNRKARRLRRLVDGSMLRAFQLGLEAGNSATKRGYDYVVIDDHVVIGGVRYDVGVDLAAKLEALGRVIAVDLWCADSDKLLAYLAAVADPTPPAVSSAVAPWPAKPQPQAAPGGAAPQKPDLPTPQTGLKRPWRGWAD